MSDVFGQLVPILIAAVLLAAVIAAAKVLLSRKTPVSFPYVRQPSLFRPAERSFLGVLEQALGERYRVFGKVRLADVLLVRGAVGKTRQAAFNRIKSKHLDFVICAADDLSILFAIELDDLSHARRQQRDSFVDRALEVAGVPLYRFPAKSGYSVQAFRETLPHPG